MRREGWSRLRATEEMILREIAGEYILVPVGTAAKRLHGMINLNESGLLLWNRLQTDCTEAELADLLLETYEVDRETAAADVSAFLRSIRGVGALIE